VGLFWSNTANDCYSSISVNTGLGLSFLRIINEDGSNGWAQVYARIPFDDRELLDKGALFGVIFGTDKEGWAEKTYANETIKRYLWDQINGCGLMAICPECGGSSISTCECARQRFYDRITDEMIEEGKKKMEEEKQDELWRRKQQLEEELEKINGQLIDHKTT